MKRNISLSLDEELLIRAERLAAPGESRTAVIERLLLQSVRAAEDAELDAAYDRALARHPVTDAERERLSRMARAAYRGVHGTRR